MRIGILRLTDAAPVIVAEEELGFFAEEDVPAVLSVEPSWGNIADKLAHGFLDAAVILPPLAFALSLGLRGQACRLIVPQAINLGGNSITLSRALIEALPPCEDAGPGSVLEWSRNFAQWRVREPADPVRLAVVHLYSTHHLLLRYWLAAGGSDPDREIAFTYIPPSQMVEALQRGLIDGFCAGAPWGDVAAEEGLGLTVASSHGIWCNGPEKVFAVSAAYAEQNPDVLMRTQRALLRAGQYCDEPENAAGVASLLARSEYLGLPAAALTAALPGGQKGDAYWRQAGLRFFGHAATMPWLSHAEWFLGQMQRWGQIAPDIDVADLATALYRPDLYRQAAKSLNFAIPISDNKTEGHSEPWLIEAEPHSLAMDPDGFFDRP